LLIYRLGTVRYPVWDGTGAAVRGGRWNPPGAPVIYAAATQSLAMLERLVQGADLDGTVLVEAEVPDDLAFDDKLRSPPPGWTDVGSPSARATGAAWLAAGRTALLRVPSVVVPREANWAINPAHPDAVRIRVGTPEKLTWDQRLFGIQAPTPVRPRTKPA